MVNIWWDNGSKGLSIKFDKNNSDGIKTVTDHAVKGVDSIHQKGISIFGLRFDYTDLEYNSIINIMLKNKDNYSRSENKKSIDILKETLNTYVKSRKGYSYTPFNWNYSIDNHTGDIVFYLTGVKRWFEENGLIDLVNGYVQICGKDEIIENKEKFPEYDPSNHKNKLFVIDC